MKKYIHTSKRFKEIRRNLRNDMTPQEKKLWSYLKQSRLGYKFQRQHSTGNYIVDFYCFKKKLIIELDGHHHADNKGYDEQRTLYFKTLGFNVLRFWNNDVNTNIEAIIDTIQEILGHPLNPSED